MPDLGTPSPTCGDVIDCYARHCRANGVHGPKARAEREYTFRVFVAALGTLPVCDAKPYHLSDLVDAHPEWRSVSTRRQKASAVNAAFNWAVTQERIARNPFKAVRYGEAERRRELPDAALAELCRHAGKPFERALWFLRLTACRLGELCQAEWPDVDLGRGVWFVRRHKSRRYTQKPKIVALVPGAVELLRAVPVTAAAAIHFAAPAPPAVSAPPVPGRIFLTQSGVPWTAGALGQTFRRLRDRLGLDTGGASLHGIRHTAARTAVVNGAPLKLVAAQLGHANTAITERFYVELGLADLDAIREAAAKGLPRTG